MHYETWNFRCEELPALEAADKFVKLLLLSYQMISNCYAHRKRLMFIITIGFEVFHLVSTARTKMNLFRMENYSKKFVFVDLKFNGFYYF